MSKKFVSKCSAQGFKGKELIREAIEQFLNGGEQDPTVAGIMDYLKESLINDWEVTYSNIEEVYSEIMHEYHCDEETEEKLVKFISDLARELGNLN